MTTSIKDTFINKKANKVHIWQSKGIYDKLDFMYKPVIISIIEFMKENIDIIIEYKYDDYDYNLIQPNDILLWVGCENIPNFDYFKDKNIYTIYYNTEPEISNHNSDEIWTYSKYLFYNYTKYDNQTIRFFPIICENTNHYIPYNLKNDDNLKLIFMGNLNYRYEKKKILFNQPIIQKDLVEIYNIWNDNDYNNLISNSPNIFINLTKGNTIILPSVRINKLLSHKCIIISEHTNEIDEAFYKDIVYFCNINEIGNIYKILINKSIEELEIESNEKYKKFYNIFNSKNIVNLITQK